MNKFLSKLFRSFVIVLVPTLFCSLMSSPVSYGLPLNCPKGSRVIGIECFNEAYENTTPWYRKDFGASEFTFPIWLVLFGAIATWSFFSSPPSEDTKSDHLNTVHPHIPKKPVQPAADVMNDKSKLWLPTNCPHCGGATSINNVQWINNYEAKCPYCGGILKQ